MKKSSIISFIALELAGTAVANDDFDFDCDAAETDDGGPGVSGFYCGGSEGNPSDMIAYCHCKKHDSCKTEWEKTCAAREDKSGVSRTCVKGNLKNTYNWRRYGEQADCQRIPQPANTVCAVDKGVLPANVAAVEAECSRVDEYFLWKASYDNSDWQKSQLDYVEQDGVEWWKLNFLPKIANVTGGFANYSDFQARMPTIHNAWNTNCIKEAKEYSCFRAFPECKKVEGEGKDVPGTAKCEAECKQVDTCIQSVETACETAKAANNSEIIDCSTYADLFPEYVTSDGQRDCEALCEENHPNSANALVGLSFFAALSMLY